MTTANQITLGRIALIPVFVGALMYYGQSARDGESDERFRWVALIVFVLASVSDALDGFIARRFNQRSPLGAILDPLADKGLLLSALIALAWLDVPGLFRLPIWFLVVVLSRDILLVAGVMTLRFYGNTVGIVPHWTGKAATGLMMAALSAILLNLPHEWCGWLVVACGACTVASMAVYSRRGVAMVAHLSVVDNETEKHL